MRKLIVPLLIAVTCVYSGALYAAPSIAPSAFLDQSMALIKDSKTPLRIEFDFEGVIDDTKDAMTINQHYTFLFKDKEMVMMSFEEDGKSYLQLYSTGEAFSIYYVTEQYYVSRDEASTRESYLSMIFGPPFNAGGTWLRNFLLHDPVLLDGVTESSYGATTDTAQQLLLEADTYTAKVQLAAGEKNWLQAAELDLSKNFVDRDVPPTVHFKLSNITIKEDPGITDAHFAFTPGPDDFDLSTSMAGGLQAGDKAAPISLRSLDGQAMRLADHKGKDVVVLDFFATWCGPCRMMMPLVDTARKNLEGRNVAFYAVNQKESLGKVKGFMDNLNLEIPVLLDDKGLVSSAYGVSSIPHMVIIGKDGIIKKVHIGGTPDLDETLTNELKALLLEG